jgi:hypothetical protein
MVLLDTNILLYAACASYSEHKKCRQLLDQIRGSAVPWFLTWPVIYEFLRVVTHPRVLSKPWNNKQAWQFVEALFASLSLSVLTPTSRHPAITQALLSDQPDLRGNIMHDVHTAALMREHGIRTILTRDKDFHHFEFLEVLDPLRK